jgi:FKBP12-rapamycin complex-associated protein
MCHFAVEHIIKQLLTMVAADMDPAVRRAIVERFLPAFLGNDCSSAPDGDPDEEGLLMFFAQSESANALTLCLNDTNAHVRLASLTIMGKIARFNPAVSFPVLRRHLQQLLGDFSSSADSARLDETAVLLSAMIEQCPELVIPNLHTIQDKLAKKLDQARERIKEHGGKSKSGHSMTDSIMQVISSLVSKATVLYRPFLPHVLESVIEAITDRWNDAKHLPAAVSCLGNITGCTGYVIEPYINHPALLPAMLELLDQAYPAALHIQVVKVLGIIGALGPHTHKLIQVPSASCLPAFPPMCSCACTVSNTHACIACINHLKKKHIIFALNVD